MRAHRGFTMMEAMVTLAIASIVAAAAAGTMALVLRTTASTRAALQVTSQLGLSSQFLSRDIENAGGLGLPGQATLVVENDNCPARDGMPACGGNDRVTVFLAVADAPVCAVRAGSRDGALSFQYTQGGCCFPSQSASGPVKGVAMLTKGAAFRPVEITGVAGAVCEFDARDVLTPDLYLNDVDVSAHAAVAATDFTPLVDGEATLVQMRTYFVDPVLHDLKVKQGPAPGAGELVTDHIFDFQVALGHDRDADGEVEDDEWAWRATATPPPLDPLPRLLPPKEVLVSLVQGLPASLRPDTVQSPLRPPGATKTITAGGFALRAGVVHLVPYNNLLRAAP